MSRNPRNDLRKKRRRQRRNVTWQCRSVDLSAFLVSGPELMQALIAAVARWREVLERMIAEHPELRLLMRRYRNPWQWQAWWRL